jgi:hypothetical protein
MSSLWIFDTATATAMFNDNPVASGRNQIGTQAFLLS